MTLTVRNVLIFTDQEQKMTTVSSGRQFSQASVNIPVSTFDKKIISNQQHGLFCEIVPEIHNLMTRLFTASSSRSFPETVGQFRVVNFFPPFNFSQVLSNCYKSCNLFHHLCFTSPIIVKPLTKFLPFLATPTSSAVPNNISKILVKSKS